MNQHPLWLYEKHKHGDYSGLMAMQCRMDTMQQSLYARLRRPDTYYEKKTGEYSDMELFTPQQTHEAIIPSDKDDVEPQRITRSITRRRSRTIPEPITTSDIETDDNSEGKKGKLKKGRRATSSPSEAA